MIPNSQFWFNSSAGLSFIEATGGTIITDGNYKIHIFNSNDNFVITQAPEGATFEYLIVAGGGGGGNGYGGVGAGGGGGGGYITSTASAAIGTFPVVIGGGGNGSPANTPDTNGTNGQNSTFYSLTAIGGGGGNSFDAASSSNGGSSGGAGFGSLIGTATAGQGNIGGAVNGARGGGGGGGGAVGDAGGASNGGNGGNGVTSDISGVIGYYGAGGGGAPTDGSATLGLGGLGGGGRAGATGGSGSNATVNTGSGGGAGQGNTGAGGNGGSGTVIVRYQYMASCYPSLNNADLTSYLVDDNTIGYSTFQSNNQKVASNANGVFFTYLVTSNGVPYSNQGWWLARTTDGGQSFTNLYNGASTASAPCLETDSSNNLYLIVPTTGSDATFYKFLSTDYTTPSVTTTLTGLAQEKYSMALDEANNKIYFASKSNKFVVLNMAGAVIVAPYTFTQNGTDILTSSFSLVAEYPNLQLDDVGNLYCAWTTAGGPSTYWNILWMVSRDFGVTWQKADGTNLPLPITVNSTGTNQISNRIDNGKTVFLSSFAYANERLHVMYYMNDGANGQKQIYQRINPTTGAIEVRTVQPLVCNPTIAGLDGFFVKPVAYGTFASPSVLYFVTSSENRYVVSSVSLDNGVTWKRTKTLDMNPATGWRVYSVGGFRNLVGGNTAYGAFTVQDIANTPLNGSGETYFIKLDV